VKAIHRFGLACLQSQETALLAEDDPAEILKLLRRVAETAVHSHGIEEMIRRSETDFNFVTNRLIADFQTTVKIHGSGNITFIREAGKRGKPVWVISEESGEGSPLGDRSMGLEWNKEEEQIRRGSLIPVENSNSKFLLKFRRKENSNSPPEGVSLSAEEEEEVGGFQSPIRAKAGGRDKVGKAFKGLRKKFSKLIKNDKTGYSKTF
jgi:hypothetical protein